MARAPVSVGSGALVTSVAVHALLLAAGALLISHSLREHGQEHVPTLPGLGRVVEVELPSFDPRALDSVRESDAPPTELSPAPTGGGPLERHPDTEHPGHGGSARAPQAATNLDSHIDPITLETNPLTHLDRAQVQRLHTASERRSWDDHRATPSPLQLTFLATGKGALRERRSADR